MAYKQRGFTAVKIKVGHPDGLERDLEHYNEDLLEELDDGKALELEDSQDLQDMAQAYIQAENANVEATQSLLVNVLV